MTWPTLPFFALMLNASNSSSIDSIFINEGLKTTCTSYKDM